jgi:hypothetical protein
MQRCARAWKHSSQKKQGDSGAKRLPYTTLVATKPSQTAQRRRVRSRR